MISEPIWPIRRWTGWTDNLEEIVHVNVVESHRVHEDQVTEQTESQFWVIKTRCDLFNNVCHKLDALIQVFAICVIETIRNISSCWNNFELIVVDKFSEKRIGFQLNWKRLQSRYYRFEIQWVERVCRERVLWGICSVPVETTPSWVLCSKTTDISHWSGCHTQLREIQSVIETRLCCLCKFEGSSGNLFCWDCFGSKNPYVFYNFIGHFF